MTNLKDKTVSVQSTKCAFFDMVEEGILRVRLKNNSEVDLEESKAMQAKSLDMTEGKLFVALVDARTEVIVSKEAREWGSSAESQKNLMAQAIFVNSLANRIVGNFIIKFHKPVAKTRLFSDEETALTWLREQKKLAGI